VDARAHVWSARAMGHLPRQPTRCPIWPGTSAYISFIIPSLLSCNSIKEYYHDKRQEEDSPMWFVRTETAVCMATWLVSSVCTVRHGKRTSLCY
jgi:hypothetical protein